MRYSIMLNDTIINLHNVNTVSSGYDMVRSSTDGDYIKAPYTYINFRGGDTNKFTGDFVKDIEKAIEKMYSK